MHVWAYCIVGVVSCMSALSRHHRHLSSTITPPWIFTKGSNYHIVHQRYLQRSAPNLLAAEQSPVFDREAPHNLVIHDLYVLFNLPLFNLGFCPVWYLAVRLISEMGYIQGDDYVRALPHQPNESEIDVGMIRGGGFCCYRRSRRFGDCCESKNGCGRSAEEPAVSGKP